MPSIAYRITLTEAYLEKAQTHFFAHHPKMRFMGLMLNKWVAWGSRAAIVGGGLFMTLYFGPSFGVIVLCSVALLLSFLGTYLMRKARSRSAHKNTLLSIVMDESGVNAASINSKSNIRWAAFRSAVTYPDGVLLSLEEHFGFWLPDASLINGTPADARELVSKQVPNYSSTR